MRKLAREALILMLVAWALSFVGDLRYSFYDRHEANKPVAFDPSKLPPGFIPDTYAPTSPVTR